MQLHHTMHPYNSRRKKQTARRADLAIPDTSRRQICFALTIAVVTGLSVAVAKNWETLFPNKRGPVIDVYWTHDCTCVFDWVDELREAGLRVRSFEVETLQYKRSSLRIPSQLSSCHVGSFLGYFIEGHVPGSAIRLLAERHPPGRGLSVIPSVRAAPDHSGVASSRSDELLFFTNAGDSLPFKEIGSPGGTLPP